MAILIIIQASPLPLLLYAAARGLLYYILDIRISIADKNIFANPIVFRQHLQERSPSLLNFFDFLLGHLITTIPAFSFQSNIQSYFIKKAIGECRSAKEVVLFIDTLRFGVDGQNQICRASSGAVLGQI